MALVDTECFMIYYDNFIGIFNKSTAAKGQKKIKMLFSLYIDKASSGCMVTDKR